METSDNVMALLNLPFGVLVVLASGYIGYRIAFTGKDKTHAAVDVIFLTLVFAAVAKIVSGLLAPWMIFGPLKYGAEYWLAGASLSVVIASAGLWRRFGEAHVFNAMRQLKVSHSDRYETAWQTIFLRSGVHPSQLVVRKKDGTAVMSERLADFAKAPFGPCLFGNDGSVALYITDFKSAGGEWEKNIDAGTPDWGLAITYVPAGEISEIEVRMTR